MQKRRRSNNHGRPVDAEWAEKQRPEAEQKSIKCREIGCAAPGAIDNQELLFHEQAVGDYCCPCTAWTEEFGALVEMCEE